MTTEKRKKWIVELTEAGITATTKMDTKRLKRMYLKFKKEQLKNHGKTPNFYAMTKTERNQKKRQRKNRAK